MPPQLFMRKKITKVAKQSAYYKYGTMGRIGSTKLVLPKWHKYGTMGRIGSTKLVLPKWHKYGTYNRHFRVHTAKLVNCHFVNSDQQNIFPFES